MIYSFDIFDTCLVRTCGNPAFVFDVLAQRVLPHGEESQRFDFALERQNGENKARCKASQEGKEEVTLEEIYSCCDFADLDNVPPMDVLMKEEQEVERAVLSPVTSVREKIESLRAEGHQIVFISDMYLPYDFVKEVMIQHGFLTDADTLYVSCQNGKTKKTGSLFKLVCDEMHLDFRNWRHFGDNKHSDYNVPRSLGIKAELVSHEYSYYEKCLRMKDLTSRTQTASLMAAIAKSVRLSKSKDIQVNFAADLVAPVFVPYVYSVLKDAEKRGIGNLYFLARDAYIFYKIALKFTKDFPTISLHYLYVSRNSLYLPGLENVSMESLSLLFTNIDWQGLDDVLTRLHLTGIKDEFVKVYGDKLGGAKDILPLLLANPTFLHQLESKWQEQRKMAVEYFKSEGLGVGKTAIVDLTGTRRCHHAINKILVSVGLDTAFGYYFEVLDKRKGGSDYKALNFFERYGYAGKRYAVAPHDLYEQYYCITPHKRTYEYAMNYGGVQPVFEADNLNEEYKKRVSDINVAVCEEFADCYQVLLQNTDAERCSEQATAVATEFFEYPKKEYLNAIKDMEISDSSVQHYKLITGESVFSVLKNRNKSPWLYGNIIYNSHIPEIWRMLLKWKSRKE